MLKVAISGAILLAAAIGLDKVRTRLDKPSPMVARETPHLLSWDDGTLPVWMAERTLHDRWGSLQFADVNSVRTSREWVVTGEAESSHGWQEFRLRVYKAPKDRRLSVAW
jgi:hypothetical protein